VDDVNAQSRLVDLQTLTADPVVPLIVMIIKMITAVADTETITMIATGMTDMIVMTEVTIAMTEVMIAVMIAMIAPLAMEVLLPEAEEEDPSTGKKSYAVYEWIAMMLTNMTFGSIEVTRKIARTLLPSMSETFPIVSGIPMLTLSLNGTDVSERPPFFWIT
jgi:hypothetical protein